MYMRIFAQQHIALFLYVFCTLPNPPPPSHTHTHTATLTSSFVSRRQRPTLSHCLSCTGRKSVLYSVASSQSDTCGGGGRVAAHTVSRGSSQDAASQPKPNPAHLVDVGQCGRHANDLQRLQDGALAARGAARRPGAAALRRPARAVAGQLLVQRALLLLAARLRQASAPLAFSGGAVAVAVALHALLHGLEAQAEPGWWLGAALSALAVVGLSYGILSRSGSRLSRAVAVLLGISGLLLALAPAA